MASHWDGWSGRRLAPSSAEGFAPAAGICCCSCSRNGCCCSAERCATRWGSSLLIACLTPPVVVAGCCTGVTSAVLANPVLVTGPLADAGVCSRDGELCSPGENRSIRASSSMLTAAVAAPSSVALCCLKKRRSLTDLDASQRWNAGSCRRLRTQQINFSNHFDQRQIESCRG